MCTRVFRIIPDLIELWLKEGVALKEVKNCEETHMRITEVPSVEGKKAQIVAKDAPFHPSGGGQPGDTGFLCGLDGDAFRAEVRDARKHKESGGVILDLHLIKGCPQPGMEVSATVDTARNRVLSQMHTAQHIFSRIQENLCEGLETQKVNIGAEESVVYMHYEGELSWEGLFDLEERTMEVVRADLPVESFFTSREEAERIAELKAKWGRIEDERIRIVRIAGVDATACSGTHVGRTGEIGGFMVTGFNGSAPDWEVRFTVHTEERLRSYGRTMRRLLREVGCRPDELEDVFLRQREENTRLRQIVDKVRSHVCVSWEERSAGGHPLYFASLPGLTKELLSAPARDCVAQRPDAFCLVLIPDSMSPEQPFPFILLRGADIAVDLSGLTREFSELNARGGGKADWLNGTTTQRSPSVWIDVIGRKCGQIK